ncbi:MAG: hypothetical protein R3189_03210 [Thiomicrorhabdus chilensis]|uniref:Flp family type IVb pilin n=1 Tax=Thiomicrorhabdus chilensis TaxID=63656 RepID=UPI00299D0662|nr:hypothetical protein [Thiomicrorhabdus chilensis]MDX1347243.1 hypothetical protein [Thiomicrorhabdus chilensis]
MKNLNAYEVMGMIKAKQLQKQKGASMIEYALLIAAVVGVATVMFGDTGMFNTIETKVTTAATGISNL